MATKTNNNQSLYFTNSDEIAKVFRRFDADGDGKISADELVHVMKAIGSSTSDDEIKQMMHNIDTDCDGFINFDEFAGFCRGTTGADDGGAEELYEAFKLYDLNNNGLISASELHQILSRLGENCTAEDCAKMISSVDSDGDGFVNFEEFKKMMASGGGKE